MPVKKILNKLNGLHYRQEYLCLAKELHAAPLHVYIVKRQTILKDITNQHLFTGYNPLIFAFAFCPDAEATGIIDLIFSQNVFRVNDHFTQKNVLASLSLAQIKKQHSGDTVIYFYKGIYGNHHFLSSFHQLIGSLYNQLFNKKQGNVFLNKNLYRQVQIAYAIPRNISLITVSDGELFNLFPTDLHGRIDDERYVISLRTGGKACEQVISAGKVLISTVSCNIYKRVYALGKNHMQRLKQKNNFPFAELCSEKFKWPVPGDAVAYDELIYEDSFVHGIHTIILFKIIFQYELRPGKSSLAHIHNSYATWRYKNKLPGNYLLR